MASTADVFNFISANIHILGWTGVFVLAWRGRGYIDKFLAGVQLSDTRLQQTHALAAEVKAGVEAIQTNHLAHVEKDMGSLAAKQDATIVVLQSIDKNIGILVDRGIREA